jgi:hypothetical protein
VQLSGSVEQALNTLLSSNVLFYSVLDERTIVVAQDTAPNRLKYERQVTMMLPISLAASRAESVSATTSSRVPRWSVSELMPPSKVR